MWIFRFGCTILNEISTYFITNTANFRVTLFVYKRKLSDCVSILADKQRRVASFISTNL
jgi:hypothetical protein